MNAGALVFAFVLILIVGTVLAIAGFFLFGIVIALAITAAVEAALLVIGAIVYVRQPIRRIRIERGFVCVEDTLRRGDLEWIKAEIAKDRQHAGVSVRA